jgi:hypothetical protein
MTKRKKLSPVERLVGGMLNCINAQRNETWATTLSNFLFKHGIGTPEERQKMLAESGKYQEIVDKEKTNYRRLCQRVLREAAKREK